MEDNKFTIRGIRKAKEITLEEMGSLVGVSARTVSNWENNPEIIPIGKAIEICNALDVDLNSITFLSKNATNN